MLYPRSTCTSSRVRWPWLIEKALHCPISLVRSTTHRQSILSGTVRLLTAQEVVQVVLEQLSHPPEIILTSSASLLTHHRWSRRRRSSESVHQHGHRTLHGVPVLLARPTTSRCQREEAGPEIEAAFKLQLVLAEVLGSRARATEDDGLVVLMGLCQIRR